MSRELKYLLDTNALSEPRKPRPDARYMAFADALPDELGFVSVISLGELNAGITALAQGRRRNALLDWLEQTRTLYGNRVLPVGADIGLLWGTLTAEARTQGRDLKPADGLIAATARHHGLAVVTRNVRDFEATGVEVVNPWEA